MSILTDFIIAPEADAERICDAQGGHAASWPCLSLKGVDNIKLAALWAIVSPGADKDALEGDEFMIYSADQEGPWVFRLPDEITARLASLGAEKIKDVAAAFGRSEEVGFDQWSENDCVMVVTEMTVFAKKAAVAQRPILLWMCL